MLCMNFVFASARFPSDFGFVSKKARSRWEVLVRSLPGQPDGAGAVVTLFKEITMPVAFEPQIWGEKNRWKGGRAG